LLRAGKSIPFSFSEIKMFPDLVFECLKVGGTDLGDAEEI
jgi:hypothetical protein